MHRTHRTYYTYRSRAYACSATASVAPQLDPHYTKRFAYAHMRPALTSDEDEEVTEIRFELQAARPLAPLLPGSLVAWCGNAIHWGTRCSSAVPPRVSVGFNFLRAGEALQSARPPLSQALDRTSNRAHHAWADTRTVTVRACPRAGRLTMRRGCSTFARRPSCAD